MIIRTYSDFLKCAGAPQQVAVSAVNSITVNVSWCEVQCFSGSGAVTRYLVQYQSMCGGAVLNVTTGGTIETVSGLTPNASLYTFRVAAAHNEITGPFSHLDLATSAGMQR